MSQVAATFKFETNQAVPGSPGSASEPANPTGASEHPVGCPQCGNLESWGPSSWCPECGFYPRLGTSVSRPADEKPPEETPVPPQSFGDAWQKMPVWAKVLCVGILAIVVESLLVHAVTADNSLFRSIWGVLQFVTGFGVFAMFHGIAAIKASMSSNRMGLMEALMHPVETWKPTIEKLPGSARRIWLAVWGLTAALCAMGIVGGIRYSAVVDDWGFKKRVDAALTHRIRSSSDKNVAGGTLAAENAKRGNDMDVLALDCVVVGYNIGTSDGRISNLFLASLVDGELRYVGTVSKGLPEEVGNELALRLAQLKRNVPVVKCRGSAIWVKPVVACKANFKSWSDDRKMVDAEFQELMAEIDYVE
jgi:hypothetical protein